MKGKKKDMYREIKVTPRNVKDVLRGKFGRSEEDKVEKREIDNILRKEEEKKEKVGRVKRSFLVRVLEYCLTAIIVTITMGLCTAMLQSATQLSSGWAAILATGVLAIVIAWRARK